MVWVLCTQRFIAQEGHKRVGDRFEIRCQRRLDFLKKGGYVKEEEPGGVPITNEQPGEWEGETAVIVAGGPSLTPEDVALAALTGWPMIVVNDGYRLAPNADILYACDMKWWKVHAELAKASGVKRFMTRDQDAARAYGLEFIPSDNKPGLTKQKGVIYEGGNSGYQAINLAYLLGARRLVLLGFDMGKSGGKSHWFGAHPKGLEVPSPYADWIQKFDQLAADLAAEGVEVINCSRETALKCFRRAAIETLIY